MGIWSVRHWVQALGAFIVAWGVLLLAALAVLLAVVLGCGFDYGGMHVLAIFAGKTMQAFFFEFVKILVAYLLPLALIAGALVFVAWGIAFIRDELE